MFWEFLRDLGLIAFASGVLFAFGLGVLDRHLGSANVAFLATIGDAMMLGGASLSVFAMVIGYLGRNAG
jgi:hypothetical protein